MRLIFALIISAAGLFAQATIDNSTAQSVIPWPIKANEPGTCNYGQIYLNSTTQILRQCAATNTWSNFVGGVGTMTNVAVLPTAASATKYTIYHWTGGTTANTCPLSGASGSGGSVAVLCYTPDNTNWVALVKEDVSQNVSLPGNLAVLNALLVPVTISTSGPVAVSGWGTYLNNSSGAITFNLPTPTSSNIGTQFCFRQATGKTGAITIATASSSIFIDVLGVNGTVGTLVSSGGGASACVVSISPTEFQANIVSGTWTNN